ncbi:MAG: hypothetical protein WC812_03370 [Candidatus Pacearchaeota archaeon]|jgi:Zn finger protein HypA/HybF involved in hydrogenase expression
MADATYIQKRMQELQQNKSFASALGKILSGRDGYVPVIEEKEIVLQCKQCQMILEKEWYFCPMCGLKIEKENPQEEKTEN